MPLPRPVPGMGRRRSASARGRCRRLYSRSRAVEGPAARPSSDEVERLFNAEKTTSMKVAALAICALLGACAGRGGAPSERARPEHPRQGRDFVAATRQAYRNAGSCGGTRFRDAIMAPLPLIAGDADSAARGGRGLLALGDIAVFIGCPGDARQAYDYVLRAFPDVAGYAGLREHAREGLASLPPRVSRPPVGGGG